MTSERAAWEELRRLAEAATPGPWYAEFERIDSILTTRVGSEGHRRGVGDYAFVTFHAGIGEDQSPIDYDAAFIVAAVNYVRDRLAAAQQRAVERKRAYRASRRAG